jgi:methanogenic corrinoid protein MtbC1
MSAHAFAASLLRASSKGFAGLVATRMIEVSPSSVEPAGFDAWLAFSNRQILALASAVGDESPELFSADLAWSREAFAARQASPEGLVSSLQCLESVLQESLPGPAWAVLPEYFRRARGALESGAVQETAKVREARALSDLAQRYLDALVAGDEHRAVDLVRAALDAGQLTVDALIDSVLASVQRELGRLWHIGALNVSDEHFATQVTRKVLALALANAPRVRPRQRTVVVAAITGDAHDIALSFVAAYFELDGWRTLLLGADTPADDLVSFVVRHQADLVALGATLDDQRSKTTDAIRALREARPALRIVVGGAAYARQPDLWRRSGADAYAADAAQAVKKGLELLSG